MPKKIVYYGSVNLEVSLSIRMACCFYALLVAIKYIRTKKKERAIVSVFTNKEFYRKNASAY